MPIDHVDPEDEQPSDPWMPRGRLTRFGLVARELAQLGRPVELLALSRHDTLGATGRDDLPRAPSSGASEDSWLPCRPRKTWLRGVLPSRSGGRHCGPVGMRCVCRERFTACRSHILTRGFGCSMSGAGPPMLDIWRRTGNLGFAVEVSSSGVCTWAPTHPSRGSFGLLVSWTSGVVQMVQLRGGHSAHHVDSPKRRK